MKPKLRYRVEYWFVCLMGWSVRAAPRRLALAFGACLGWFAGVVVRLRRSVVDANLETAFGKEMTRAERNRLARRSYAYFGSLAADILRGWTRTSRALDLVDPLEGGEWFDAASGKGKGAGCFFSGHLGHWEMMGPALARHGLTVTAVGKPIHNPLVDRLVREVRAVPGYSVISTKDSMRTIVAAVREGQYVGFIADQDARKGGEFVDFFGRPASTAPGPAYFCVRMKMPLFPVFCTRADNGRYRMEVEEPLWPNEELDQEEAILDLTRRHVQRLEARIRQHPEQYWWFHRRWKTQPD